MWTNQTRTALMALLIAGVAAAGFGPEPLSQPLRPAEAAPAERPAASSAESISSSGRTRTYRLFVPSSYRPGSPVPLVLSLHGMSLSGAGQERMSGMSAVAEQGGFIVAYPDGTGFIREWHTEQSAAGQADLQFMHDLIGHLEARFTIDASRIYASGLSQGAMMAYKLGCNSADRIAGLGLVAGGYPPASACGASRPLPIVVFHGTADGIVSYNGEGGRPSIPVFAAGWAARNGCGNGPYTSLQQGSVTGQTWDSCHEDATVTVYTVAGGGHSWPGTKTGFWSMMTTDDIDATALMISFFAAHPRH